MFKYAPLSEWLKRQQGNRIRLPFEDIEDEDKIGVRLPRSARERSEWWGNEVSQGTRHSQCRAWLETGWKVESVNLRDEYVVLVRL